jgi:hypothetical protein
MDKMEARDEEPETARRHEMNGLTRWSIVLMIAGFLLFTVPLILFPLQAAPAASGIQAAAQYLGLPVLGIGFILLFVGLMRNNSTR